MAKASRRVCENREQLPAGSEPLPLSDALRRLLASRPSAFDESVDVALKLGLDTRQGEQQLRGATSLPHGSGKETRVAVFAEGVAADEARSEGAQIVGMDDLAESIRGGEMDFDVVIAQPSAMPLVGKLGQILGPRGLMPSPKQGTVTAQVGDAVRDARKGQLRFRAERGGIVHGCIGRRSFTVEALSENLLALLADVRRLRPVAAKGHYLRRVSLSTTMGPSVAVDMADLEAQA